ncbi:MAG: SpoIIE family protein phosphatase [Planctomycetia bacterium]|nr:SpoIIE family protein phosphatase [Planctomycetia bacterium]
MAAALAKLLIVDDEELNREGLARRLQKHDYSVTVAKSGREAIELLGKSSFDLVLLDIMMPGMNGLEVLKFLRRVDSLLALPIIMVTAKSESEDIVEALELGANDYVTKPLDFPVVLARIRTQLALRGAIAQVKELERKLDAHNRELESAAVELASANDRLTRDLEAAAAVQRALLPALPPELPGARFAWTFEPCSQLAGDYLNVFQLDDRHVGLCVLDVSGHGVASALLSVTASQLLARVARNGTTPVTPSEVAKQLDKELHPEATAGHTFSLLYGILALDTGEFRFVSAGHPGPIHVAEGSPPTRLEVSGFPVGVGNGTHKEHTVTLKRGDRLLLYTDGLTEVRNADGEHFGNRRLQQRWRRLVVDRSTRYSEGWSARWKGGARISPDTMTSQFSSLSELATTNPGGSELPWRSRLQPRPEQLLPQHARSTLSEPTSSSPTRPTRCSCRTWKGKFFRPTTRSRSYSVFDQMN